MEQVGSVGCKVCRDASLKVSLAGKKCLLTAEIATEIEKARTRGCTLNTKLKRMLETRVLTETMKIPAQQDSI